MVAYAASFLTVILVAVPYGFHHAGHSLLPDAVHAWLAPGSAQRVLGGAIFLAALAGYLISALWLVIVGKGPFVEFDPPTEFVATGPYRWMRNPVAACLVVAVLGEAVCLGSAGIFALFLLGIPLAHCQVIFVEEPRLRNRFGGGYIDYCRRVPRWLPRRPRTDAASAANPSTGSGAAAIDHS